LLVLRAQRRARLLADDREHGLTVELGVVQPVQEMDRPRPRGREADAQLAGELRMPAGHERAHLFVPCLDELHVVAVGEREYDAVDPVAGIAVDAAHGPLAEALEHVLADGHGHRFPYARECPSASTSV
jgi:hypothetical protein